MFHIGCDVIKSLFGLFKVDQDRKEKQLLSAYLVA